MSSMFNAGAAWAVPDYSQLAGMNGANPNYQFDFSNSGLGGSSGLTSTPFDVGSIGAPGGAGSGGAGTGMGPLGIANAALSGVQTLANLWNSFQANKMAKKQFKFTKQMTRTNLANQVQSYNTALQDRARSRGFTEGQTQDQINKYYDDNHLTTSSRNIK